MKKYLFFITFALACGLVFAGCNRDNGEESMESLAARVFERAAAQFNLLDQNLDEAQEVLASSEEDLVDEFGLAIVNTDKLFPRTLDSEGGLVTSNYRWWCSGFFPGSLWFMYGHTGEEHWKELALKYTLPLAALSGNVADHDIGFQLMSSFGQGLKLTGDKDYEAVLTAGAEGLAGRFNEKVGCTMSWDKSSWSQWDYPVIIDNMMNLELLFAGAALSGNEHLRDVAVCHAETTMKNHFREDYSTFHLVVYDPKDGHVVGRQTVQGYADDSAWSRGQAWGLYGYTMVYRFTKDEKFKEQAVHIAEYLLPRLPEDGVPYWDYDAPDIPNDFRDASAGAVMASGLVELSGYVDEEKAERYLDTACKILRTLASDEYLAQEGEIQGFLLKHSVGNKPSNSEVDVPLTYADYYFLEALTRYLALGK